MTLNDYLRRVISRRLNVKFSTALQVLLGTMTNQLEHVEAVAEAM